MCHDFTTSRLYVYDFSYMLARGRDGAAAFSWACAVDLVVVDALVTGPGRAWESSTASGLWVLYVDRGQRLQASARALPAAISVTSSFWLVRGPRPQALYIVPLIWN
jgi:hypothetical protein